MKFHHGVVAVRDLEQAIRTCGETLGLNARAGGRHGGRGTENAVIRFRDSYIELLSIFDAQKEIAASGLRGQVLADYLAGHEGGLVGYCLDTTEVFRQTERLRAAGLDVPDPLLVTRKTPAGDVLKWHVLLPGGVNWRRPWPFLIQPDAANVDEGAGESQAPHRLGATGVAGLSVAVEDLASAKKLYEQFGLKQVGEGRVPELGAQRARFKQEGFSIDLLAPSGPGPVRAEIDGGGESLFELRLRVDDLQASKDWLARSGIATTPAPGHANAWLIPPERAMGARLVLTA